LPYANITGARDKLGVKFLDAGSAETAFYESGITYIDGLAGILEYRGIPIQELVKHSNHTEVSYLLRKGNLPTKAELADYNQELAQNAGVSEHVKTAIRGVAQNPDIDSMAALQSVVPSLPSKTNGTEMIAKMPTVVANIIRLKRGKENIIEPDPNLSYAENFLRMCFADDQGNYKKNPVLVAAMDKILLLHADHEMNCSTQAVRGIASGAATLTASISGGVGALSGPLHGGANRDAVRMHAAIGSVENIPAAIERAKNKMDDFLVMGFGHRVYKNFDPRAAEIKAFVDALLADLGVDDPRLAVAKELERLALEDPYFKEKKLFPNVDFYSGIALSAMGFHEDDFTLLFELGRITGQVAHYEELRLAEKLKIIRPDQGYNGPKSQRYVDIDHREGANRGPPLNDNAAATPAAPAA